MPIELTIARRTGLIADYPNLDAYQARGEGRPAAT